MGKTVVEKNHKDKLLLIILKYCEFQFQTIQDLLKKAQQGKAIDENDIPPKIAVNEPTKQRMGKAAYKDIMTKIYIFIYR